MSIVDKKRREAHSTRNTKLRKQHISCLVTTSAREAVGEGNKVDPITATVFAHLGDLQYTDTDDESSEQATGNKAKSREG